MRQKEQAACPARTTDAGNGMVTPCRITPATAVLRENHKGWGGLARKHQDMSLASRRPASRLPRLLGATTALGVLALGVAPLAWGAEQPANTYTPYAIGINGGEPSIGFDPIRNVAVYGSGTNNKRLAFDDSVSPATVTISDAKAPTSVTSLDAITFIDQATGRLFVSQLAAASSLFAFSDDAGKTYTPSQGAGVGTVLDHQSVGGGPFHAPLTGGTSLYKDAVYYCAQNSYNGACALSPNGGLNFFNAVPTYNTPANAMNDPNPTIRVEGGGCSALHGHLRVGPDGTAYLPVKGCAGVPTGSNATNTEFAGGHPAVSVSTDNGTSWQVSRVDGGNNQDESDPSVAAGRGDKFPGGRVYLGWEDGVNTPVETGYGTTSAAKIAMSTNDGKTFSAPVDVSTPLGIQNVQFPEVIAGDDDRAAFAWLGTKVAGDDQHSRQTQSTKHPDAIDPSAEWHLYVSRTFDGGATWTTVDTTPTDPVQRGCISLQGTSNRTIDDPPCTQRNLLDFNDITVDKQGRPLVAYADGCQTDACNTGTPASATANLSSGAADFVMRQTTGPTLYAANDLPGGGPGTDVPESPLAVLLPLGAVSVAGLVLLRRTRRRTA